jgi:hypothetical protein
VRKGTLFAARGDAVRAEEMLRAGLEVIEEAGFTFIPRCSLDDGPRLWRLRTSR